MVVTADPGLCTDGSVGWSLQLERWNRSFQIPLSGTETQMDRADDSWINTACVERKKNAPMVQVKKNREGFICKKIKQ